MLKKLSAWIAANTLMALALAGSLGAHALILTINFIMPQFTAVKAQDPGLEIVLMNAKSERAPTQAEVLAQVNFEGGGDKDRGRATSPLPNTGMIVEGDALAETRRRQEEFEAAQRALLSQLQMSKLQLQQQKQIADKPQESGPDLADAIRQIQRQQAIIENRIEEENKRPKKHHFGTSAKDSAAALYVENFKQRFERWGNQHYPDVARGVYGQVQITVVIDKFGQIYSLELSKSSGNKALDNAALNIVRRAGPYGRFSGDMAKQMDLLSITRTVIFSQGSLETRSAL
ncbi:MAG: energy transducer TonB [Burkholderiales bacterium]|jgi:protein TonB|nr:energy transducer TonB [Burkholderiales bacterium]MCA3162211.1 energy transducer TonB [Burkholderiales bacterium]MCA3165541.1 energy transducer TonB [Burkholderiales bacterium]MCA3171154.1 energy transducer TonB [Burkholderiales bacterium]MCA3172675.1 energy transducer TonB [Burkholderiales bacterium]